LIQKIGLSTIISRRQNSADQIIVAAHDHVNSFVSLVEATIKCREAFVSVFEVRSMILETLESLPLWLSSETGEMAWFSAYWGFLALIAGLEYFFPGFQRLPRRGKRWPMNLGLGLLNVLLAPLAPVSVVWGAQWAQTHEQGLLNFVGGPWWIALTATLVIRSFVGYAIHVLSHKVPLFWRLHRVHHLDTHVDVTTTLRTHPLELALAFLILLPVTIALGLTPWILAVYEIVQGVAGLLSHANLRLPERLDRSLRWIFVTPNMHCLHHSSYQPETDSNYGQIFSVWDRLFGTYSAAPSGGYDAMEMGLKEVRDERVNDLWWQIKSPALRIEPAGEHSVLTEPDSA
jgi:sterol desaturase/sphingolipid hydroxylase (fatty acid hydroxylase superfamily)